MMKKMMQNKKENRTGKMEAAGREETEIVRSYV